MISGLDELAAVAGDFAFWPGWEFRPYLDPHLGLMIWITGTVPDRDDVTRPLDLGIRSRVPPHALDSTAQFGRWLLWRLEEIFIHETREGLRYKGELVDDPHAGGREPDERAGTGRDPRAPLAGGPDAGGRPGGPGGGRD